jgi:MFS family permease
MGLFERNSFRALSYPNFRRVFPASLASNIGSWAQFVAQDWLVLELTGSAFLLSIVAMLQLLPSLFFSVPAGALADRFNKRFLLIGTNLTGFTSAIALGLLVSIGDVQVWQIMLLALILGIANSIDGPVRQAFNSELVGPENVANAVSLISANVNVARLIGPALSGILISTLGNGPAFFINAISFAYMAVVLISLDTKLLYQIQISATLKPIREGVSYLRKRPDLQATLLIVFIAAGFGLNFNFLNAVMAKNVFELSATSFGLLGSAAGIGSLAAAIYSTKLEHLQTPKFVAQTAIAFGLILTVAAWMPTVWSYAALIPVVGFGVLLTMISGNGVMQVHTEVQMRGRVLGWFMLAFNAPLGQPILGWLAITVSDRFAISAAGFLTSLLVAIVWLSYRKSIAQTGLYR